MDSWTWEGILYLVLQIQFWPRELSQQNGSYWVSCLPTFKLKAGCNYGASFGGSAAIILLKENLVLIIFDFACMRVKSLQIDMDNSEMALVLQITCFVLKWLRVLIYYKKVCRNFYVRVTHYVEATVFWCSSEGENENVYVTCLVLSQGCGIKDGWVYAWGGGERASLLPLSQEEPVCFPCVESFWEVKIWFD